jgi:hypothetical protein
VLVDVDLLARHLMPATEAPADRVPGLHDSWL